MSGLLLSRGLVTDRSVVAARMVMGEARDDMSRFILEDFLKAGFREVEWRYGFESWQNTDLWRELGSVCPICFALDGQRFKIKWLLDNMRHDAPKYTMAHVNCGCQLFRIDRQNEMLDYGEEMETAPAAVDKDLMKGPFDLGQVPDEQRQELGLPQEKNEWTDQKWTWDEQRMEFVPLQTILDQGAEAKPWLWDARTNEFVDHNEWIRRYGVN